MPQLHGGLMGDAGGYQITNSVRLRAAASAYFSRTFGTPTAANTSSTSFWFKKCAATGAAAQVLFQSGGTAASNGIWNQWNASDIVSISNSAGTALCTSSAVIRDPSAWYHFCIINNAGTWTLYSNNVSIATGSGTCNINQGSTAHYIGCGAGASYFADGYLADFYFIDGQALTPSSFGQTDSNGVWVPKAYSGTYGTNGFHLDFKDAALTAGSNVGLGKDVSGNGNYWNTNNISVTAGVTYDSMVDTPTNNYATLNPLNAYPAFVNSGVLRLTSAGANWFASGSTIAVSSGKWYWEVTAGTTAGSGNAIGIEPSTQNLLPVATYVGLSANGYGYYSFNGNMYHGGASTGYGASWTSTDVIGVVLDMDAGTITFYKNGVSQGQMASGLTGAYQAALSVYDSGNYLDINFGQRPFTYTPPTGFKALCTANRTGTITVSGTFTGNAAANGPFVWIGGVPTVLTINGNAVTFGTHADKTAGGFKLRTASASYNASGSNTWTATATMNFGTTSLSPAPAQGNP